MSAVRGLAKQFSGLAAATMLLATPACAQDNSQTAEATQIAANANSCAVTQETMPPPEVLELSHNCDAVIYYNESVSTYQAEGQARSFRNREGYDVVAVQGFPRPDEIVVIMNGRVEGGRAFTQSEMMRGQVGSLIMREMGHPATAQAASFREASFDN